MVNWEVSCVEKKAISIIALDPRAARSYGRDVEGLFGEVADVSVFSVMDGSAMGMLPHADLFAASTDAFGSPEELARHVPIDSQTMAVQASFRWQELRRLKELPAGSRVLFVNMTETMAREAIAQLEQFGIYKSPDETVLETLQRVFSTDFLSHNDNAFLDLTIDKSLEINDGIGIEPNVYYFSYAGNQTVQDPVSGNYIPSARMWTLFYPGAYNMGKYYDKYTAGGFYIDKSWRPNDGMVNTVSAFYPIHSDGTCLTKDGKQGWTNYDGYSNINFQPGIWYVMPVQSFDHIQFVGGMLNGSLVKTRALYRGIMEDIYSTYTTAATGTAFPFTDVAESRWSYPYIKELYDAGVVSGTSATTFSPAANVTRAQFVTMLAGLAGADVSNCPATPFRDVPEGAWYAPYVNWALANGIVSGTSAVTFSPDASITRQDMAVMLYSYTQRFQVHLQQQQPVKPFTDAGSIAAYAQIAVQTLQRAGVISGMPDGSFQPYGTATREQACTMLCML